MLGTLINVGVATMQDLQLDFSDVGAVSRDPVDETIHTIVYAGGYALAKR